MKTQITIRKTATKNEIDILDNGKHTIIDMSGMSAAHEADARKLVADWHERKKTDG